MRNLTQKFALSLKGMAMGMAEVVPGVSGGTIAFITGIYEELIDTIKAFDLKAIKTLFKGNWADLWKHINGNFLVMLLAGMAVGVVIGVFGISHLMETEPEALWAFFFGLIIASAIYIGRQVKKWNLTTIGILLLGVVVAYWITCISPAEASTNPLYVFLCGAIAISALILPGISGSFILLLMGMYTVIIPLVKSLLQSFETQALITVGIFAAGCLVGLLSFSRVMSWMFQHYERQTLGLLTGFMIGSLNKIWPWRNPTKWMYPDGALKDELNTIGMSIDDIDHIRVMSEQNVLPAEYVNGEPQILLILISAIVGFAIVFVIDGLAKKLNN